MKRYFLAAILMLATTAAVSGQSFTYREATGKDPAKNVVLTVEPAAGGYLYTMRMAENGTGIRQTFAVDTRMATLRWTYWNEAEDTEISAARRDERIELTGRHHGKPIAKKYAVGSVPWNQLFAHGLRWFVLSGDKEYVFWAVGTTKPAEMQIARFKASRSGSATMALAGGETRAVKVVIAMTGFKSLFWHADCWHRESDGLYLRYEARNGPGAPMTVVELIDEAK